MESQGGFHEKKHTEDDDGDLIYAARYEHLLLQERKYRDLFLRKTDHHTINLEDTNKASIGMAKILTNRAEMITMLKKALQSAKNKAYWTPTENNQKHVEALETLLDETWNGYMYEWDDFETFESNSNPSINPYLSFGSIVAVNAMLPLHEMPKNNITRPIQGDRTGPKPWKEMIDAFFNDYPECKKEIDHQDGNDNDDDEGDDDLFGDDWNAHNDNVAQVPLSYPSSSHLPQSSDYSSKTTPFRTTVSSKINHNTMEPAQQQLSNISRNRPPPFDINHSYDHAPKDTGNVQSVNPYQAFKTAKEFAMDSKSDPVYGHSSNGGRAHTHNHVQQNFDYGATDNDPWGSFTPSTSKNFTNTSVVTQSLNPTIDESTTNSTRPALSAGLKRKFQLPKPRPTNHPGTASGSGYTTAVKPPAQQPHGTTEEDNLPEELKGLDKELISKIEMEIVDSGDPVSFQDIAGLADAKQTVMELVCWPMKRPDLFTGLRRGPNGLLLFGPPGTGKTLIGKAIAHESGATFFSISSSSLTSKWIGEGEKLVRTLFAVAGYREPSVVFIDEIDSLLTQRKADENEASRRIKTEFLVQLDGTGTSGRGRVLVVGATNRPQELDDAARRRFVKRLYIPLPETEDRAVLLKTLLLKNVHNISDVEIERLSIDTHGFSGADLKALCTDAALGPIRQLGARALDVDAKDVPPISYSHFQQALRGMNPSVAPSDLKAYLEWNDTYGSKKIIV